MSSPSRSLASLPELVLREVLACLLVDTPRAHHRTAVLSTCSTLHDLGLPYLYRIVDIIATLSSRLASHLFLLFGPDGGLLTTSGTHQGLGRNVVELRVGAEANGSRHSSDVDDVAFGTVHLPRCTRLTVDHTSPLPSPLRVLVPQLPVIDLVLTHAPRDDWLFPIGSTYPYSLAATTFGTSAQPWSTLERVILDGYVPYDVVFWINLFHGGEVAQDTLPFGGWTFRTLAFDLQSWNPPFSLPIPEEFTDLFFYLPLHSKVRLVDVERIELRLVPEMEVKLRAALERGVRKDEPDEERDRLLGLMVFVGPDGKESRLIETDG